jgi:hypothetical protein
MRVRTSDGRPAPRTATTGAHDQEGNRVHGDVVGGHTGVWIHAAYLDC